MQAQLSEFLDATVTPERKTSFLRVMNALEEVGFEAHNDELVNFIGENSVPDTEDVVENVERILRAAVTSTLSEFGITLATPWDMDVGADIITAVIALDNYEDHSTLLTLLSNTDSPEAIFADLLEVIGQFDTSAYLIAIETVSPALLERLELVCAASDPVDVPSETQVHSAARLKLLTDSLVERDLKIHDYVESGLPTGLPLYQYTNRFHEIADDWKPQRLALEVLGIVLASSLPDDQLDSVAAAFIEGYARDIHRATEVISLYKALKKEIDYAKA